MRKIVYAFFVGISIIVNLSSCKSESKKEDADKVAAPFALKYAKNDIHFTAYKTSEKIPVGGQFSKIEIVSGGTGNSVKEAINNTEFSIPVSSILTKDSSRDYKIKKFFFGVMSNTDLLSGKLLISDDSNGIAKITMNGETIDVPFTYTIVDKIFNMQATIDVNNWNASAALASLNKVCEDLHKGSDGVSVTWSEVALNITSTFN
jgi:hypothetical protein